MLPLLAIETSSELCSVALMINEKIVYEINVKEKHIHSKKLLSMTDEVLKLSGIDIKDLKSTAVSIGPGSFTGLRIGLSAAKGIALGANLPIIPVPTFEVLAFDICRYLPDRSKFAIANVVNSEELYFAKYKKTNGSYETIEELKLIKKEKLDSKVSKDELIFGDYRNKVGFTAASQIANWSYIFGKDLLTFEYDYLEPNYLKKFVTRVKL